MEPNRWTIDDDGDLRRGERLPLRSDGTTVRTVFGLLCTDELREVLERGQALAAPAADPLPEGVHRAHGTMTALAEDVVLLGVGWEWFDIDTFRWLPAQGNDARKPHMRAGCVYEVRPAPVPPQPEIDARLNVSVAKAEAELTVRFDTDATNADVLLAVNAVLTSNRSVSVLVDGDQT
jgi:hypothetical protein